MAVPAHDTRDYAFAKKFNLEIIPVLEGGDITKEAYTEDGIHINSGFLNGMDKPTAIKTMLEYLEAHSIGKKKINYKFREWIFARQRYWGEPVPIVYLDNGEIHALDDDELPLVLPELDDYKGKMVKPLLKMPPNGKNIIIMVFMVFVKLQLCQVQPDLVGILCAIWILIMIMSYAIGSF